MPLSASLRVVVTFPLTSLPMPRADPCSFAESDCIAKEVHIELTADFARSVLAGSVTVLLEPTPTANHAVCRLYVAFSLFYLAQRSLTRVT